MPALLTIGSFSAVATLDIVLTAYTSYRGIQFIITETIPATDGSIFQCRFSTDGGSTYDAAAGNYGYDARGTSTGSSTSATAIALCATAASNLIGNGSTEGCDSYLLLSGQTNTARWGHIYGRTSYINNAATPANEIIICDGSRRAAQDTDAIRFFMSTTVGGATNNMTGKYGVYGWR